MPTPQQLGALLRQVREQRPLLHHITNFVTMNDVANATLHLGALPVMAHAAEEVAEMVTHAQALVLNLGTLSPDRLDAMLIAGRKANASGVPIVLDPVGVGATTMRQAASQRVLEDLQISVVRGNAAEIGFLAGASGTEVRGVESVVGADDPIGVSRRLARAQNLVVAMTGPCDIVSDGERAVGVSNGHHWLTTLSGTGCMATAAIAAFRAVEPDGFTATVAALAAYGVAAELAASQARGPASFKVAFFDQLYHLTETQVVEAVCLETYD